MQVLDPSGNVVGDRYPEKLTSRQHIGMLTAMRVARRLDEEFINLQRQGQPRSIRRASDRKALRLVPRRH